MFGTLFAKNVMYITAEINKTINKNILTSYVGFL
jgi:hypothetical protein